MQPSALHPAVATSAIGHHHLGLPLKSTPGVASHNSFHPTLHVRRVMPGSDRQSKQSARNTPDTRITIQQNSTQYEITKMDFVAIRYKAIELEFHLFKS